jgi:uncharacterized protein YjbI with pentapeptide repeats
VPRAGRRLRRWVARYSDLGLIDLVRVVGRRLGRWSIRYATLGVVGLAWVVALAGVVGLVGLLVWRVPPLLYKDVPDLNQRAAAEASTRTGLIAGLVGLAALGGLVVTARTYRLTQQGQITDRYTKAIEQLGAEKLEVRLGGIYALERIAVDSKRDHPTIVEVLSAFVRERTALRTDKHQLTASEPKPKPAVDVQAAVTVLGRLPRRDGVSRGDLRGAVLAGARLHGADLYRALLQEVDLSGAGLHGAKLSQSSLEGADLSDAQLYGADLSQADLSKANLSGASLLLGADLSGTLLREAHLSGAQLSAADLSGASLTDADLSDASLVAADLSGAYLIQAKLPQALLHGAKLSRANFGMADLSGAQLQGAKLPWAWLDGADLSGAQLQGAHLSWAVELTQEQLDSATGDAMTQLPDALQRPSGWTTGAGPA